MNGTVKPAPGFIPPPPPQPLPGENPGDYMERMDAARDEAYSAWMAEQAKGPRHIRKQAGPNLGNQFYSHRHRTQFIDGYVDPMSQTLCGAPAGHFDETWADTRYPKNRAAITCQQCIDSRLADPKAHR